MEKDVLDKYLEAGRIAKRVLEYAERLLRQGCRNAYELAEKIEAKIFELGGEPAFPVNISVNDVAAHFTPCRSENFEIKEEDYVKVDVGVHVDGYIADTAKTFRLAGRDELIECAETALKEALKIVAPGVEIKEVGKVVQEVANSYGFKPVTNLTGHGLERYNLHAGVTIPNIPAGKGVFESGRAYAIEPFCTPGQGAVKDSDKALIFMVLEEKPVRLYEARKVLEIARKYKGLPFAKRWMEKEISGFKLELALKELVRIGALHAFYVLREVSHADVAQAEHTLVLLEDKTVVTTW